MHASLLTAHIAFVPFLSWCTFRLVLQSELLTRSPLSIARFLYIYIRAYIRSLAFIIRNICDPQLFKSDSHISCTLFAPIIKRKFISIRYGTYDPFDHGIPRIKFISIRYKYRCVFLQQEVDVTRCIEYFNDYWSAKYVVSTFHKLTQLITRPRLIYNSKT